MAPARSEPGVAAEARLPTAVDLHARPAADFVRTAMAFAAEIKVTHDDNVANAKSLMSVLALGAKGGAALTLSAQGSDAEAAVEALAACVAGLE